MIQKFAMIIKMCPKFNDDINSNTFLFFSFVQYTHFNRIKILLKFENFR